MRSSGASVRGLVLADMNHDGVLDIVASDVQGHRIFVLRGNGMGGFAGSQFPTLTAIQRFAVADCDADGHPEQPALRRALEELTFFSSEVRVLGVYPAAPFRLTHGAAD